MTGPRPVLFDVVRDRLRRDRWELTRPFLPTQERPDGADFLLHRPSWIPDDPVPLDSVRLRWSGQDTGSDPRIDPRIDRARRRAGELVPFEPATGPGETYSGAIRRREHRDDLTDHLSYRLLRVDDDDGRGPVLSFGTAGYFDMLDTTLVLEYEAASGGRRYRTWLGDPFDLTVRAANPGVVVLTLVRGRAGPRFMSHRRAGTGTYPHSTHLVPAGEFQPIDRSPRSVERDLDVWSTICREYAEEFLGHPDATGSAGWSIDWSRAEPYRTLQEARRSGGIRVLYLGCGLDPLTWKPDLLVVCVVDDAVHRRVFPGVDELSTVEGRIVDEPFTEEVVARHLSGSETLASARAALSLAWRRRDVILG